MKKTATRKTVPKKGNKKTRSKFADFGKGDGITVFMMRMYITKDGRLEAEGAMEREFEEHIQECPKCGVQAMMHMTAAAAKLMGKTDKETEDRVSQMVDRLIATALKPEPKQELPDPAKMPN